MSSSQTKPEVKCKKFCPYNKKKFCPFYYESDPINETPKKEVIPKEIKTKKQSIKPAAKTNVKNSGSSGSSDNQSNAKTKWMTFYGEFINDVFSSNFTGKMVDLKLANFEGQGNNNNESENENNFSIELEGKFLINDKSCDFGGDVEISLKIKNNNGNTNSIEITNYFLTGKFQSFYKSGGTTLPPPDDNENEEIPTEDEEVSMKFYKGNIYFFDYEIFNGTINFYTDM